MWVISEGVKGGVMIRRDSFVVWAFNRRAALERRWRGFRRISDCGVFSSGVDWTAMKRSRTLLIFKRVCWSVSRAEALGDEAMMLYDPVGRVPKWQYSSIEFLQLSEIFEV